MTQLRIATFQNYIVKKLKNLWYNEPRDGRLKAANGGGGRFLNIWLT
jgi:hypothetical protein